MNSEEYLTEFVLKEYKSIGESFEKYCQSVFSTNFYNKNIRVFNKVKIKFKNNPKIYINGYTRNSRVIYVNENSFNLKSESEKMRMLCHELIHIFQFKGDRKLKILGKKMWELILDNMKDEKEYPSAVIMGVNTKDSKYINEREVVPYLMNYNFDFSLLNSGTRRKLKRLVEGSGIFNMNSSLMKLQFK